VPPNVPAPIRILCVDDNRDAAESLALILQVVGLEAEAAFDGPSALRALERFRPHACVSDINMPGMDGYELARRLRAMLGPWVTLVAVTGRAGDETARLAVLAGFDWFFTKPADPDDLLTALAASDDATDEHTPLPPT
jgi:two-component system, OmpR family, response regulator